MCTGMTNFNRCMATVQWGYGEEETVMCYKEVGEVVGESCQGTVESVEKRRVLGPVQEEVVEGEKLAISIRRKSGANMNIIQPSKTHCQDECRSLSGGVTKILTLHWIKKIFFLFTIINGRSVAFQPCITLRGVSWFNLAEKNVLSKKVP